MSETPFYCTKMGRDFYDRTMPRLVEELARRTDQLAKLTARLEAQGAPKEADS